MAKRSFLVTIMASFQRNSYSLALVLLTTPAFGNWTFFDFRLNQLSLAQTSPGGNLVYTGQLNWNPSYAFGEQFSLVGNLGGSPFLSGTGSWFPAFETTLLAEYRLGGFAFEAGGGWEYWVTGSGVHSPVAGFNILYQFKNNILSIIHGFFLGYSAIFQSPLAHEAKLGVEFRLGAP